MDGTTIFDGAKSRLQIKRFREGADAVGGRDGFFVQLNGPRSAALR
ncbi:hypothetical protein [Streptomyces sp. NPDC054958]